jgi:hypothetical protein
MPDRMNVPYDFEEFERRALRAAAGRRNYVWSAAASVAALGLVVTLAVVTQRNGLSGSYAISGVAPSVEAVEAVESTGDLDDVQPALVDLDQLALQGELEDRIAWYDAQLSVGRVGSAPADQLRELESTRALLADSLQHISYAHSLLNL